MRLLVPITAHGSSSLVAASASLDPSHQQQLPQPSPEDPRKGFLLIIPS